jgi:RNA polymerase sigma factor (sigma-70 family)
VDAQVRPQLARPADADNPEPLDFEDIVRRHQAMVFSIAFHFLQDRAAAEELAQDVFLQLYRHLPGLQSAEHITFWLRKVASHRCIDYARRRRLTFLSLTAAPEPLSEERARDPFLTRHVRAVVASLSQGSSHRDPAVSGRSDAERDFGRDRHPHRDGEEPAAALARHTTRQAGSSRRRPTAMTYTDDGLRNALQRVEPPAGFTDRVMARARKGNGPLSGHGSAWSAAGGSMARWAAAAVLVVAVTGGVWYRAELRRQAEGEAARRQVLLSLRIAGAKLQHVQAKVLNQL